jgi:zinc-ribbon domain
MAFCTSCGAASEATAAFCPSCGTKALHAPAQVTTAPTPVPPAPMAQPVAVAKAGAPWMKILVVVGVLFVGGLAALVYGAYWVKNKVVSTAAVHGITWPSGDKANSSGGPFSGGSASKSKRGQLIDACSLISQEDADAVLGEPSTRSEHQADDAYSSHCHYSVAEATHATNGFGVEIHNNEDASEARTGQTLSKGIYSNFAIYNYQDLSGFGDGGFLAVSKSAGDMESSPLAGMVARQQVLMAYKGSRNVNIIVSYFGKAHTDDALKTLTQKILARI